jgi:hypothetical protein
MPTMTKALIPFRLALIALAVAMLPSCATMNTPSSSPDFRVEDFGSSDTFSRVFPGNGKTTCEAARRALLSQGYVIVGEANDAQVLGRKNFQPDRDVHEQIEFHVVCAPNARGSNSATAFANAVLDRYSLKKSTSSASLGVGVLGSVSLPFGSTDDALVKVASETISRRKFYDRFFEVMEGYLDNSVVERAEEGTLDAKPVEQKSSGASTSESKPVEAKLPDTPAADAKPSVTNKDDASVIAPKPAETPTLKPAETPTPKPAEVPASNPANQPGS